jgi:cytochrome c-type biogenesis protein
MMETLVNNLQLYLQGSYILAFLTAYIGGILVGFTPCTYPLIPVTVGFIGAQGSTSRLRGFLLALSFVLGMALTYALMGAIAVFSGRIFGQIQTTPWTYFIMANLCIFMGLSLLDVFTISLPIPQKLLKHQGSTKTKGFFSSFLIGATSGIIVGPCTAPVLGVLLGYVALRTNIVMGMSLLFIFAFGMGTLLIIAGTFAGFIAALPRSGKWMNHLTHIFGWILIGAGEYFLYTAGTLAY